MNDLFNRIRHRFNYVRELGFLLPWIGFGVAYPLVDRGFVYFFHRAFPWYTGWEAFGAKSLIVATASNWAWLLAVALVLIPSVVLWDRLSWSTIDLKSIRPVITVLAIVYAWNLSFSGYNYLYNEGFLLERLAILGLAILVYKHPSFLVPLLITGFGFSSQYELTFADPLLPEPFLFTRLFFVFLVFLFLRVFVSVRDEFLVFALFCVPFGFLWQEGMVKLFSGEEWFDWAIHYNPAYAGAWARTQGWWGFFSGGTIASLTQILTDTGWLLPHFAQWVGLTVPLVVLGFPLMVFYLGLLIALLLLVFLIVGVLLWKEILALGLLGYLLTINRTEFFRFLSGKQTLLSLLFLVAIPVIGFFPNFGLTWWETRYVSRIDLQVIDEAGEDIRFYPEDFRPYQDRLGISSYQLRGIIPFPYLPSSAKDLTRSLKLNSMLDNEEMELSLNRAKMEFGKNTNNKWHTRQFQEFLKTYLSNAKTRTRTQIVLQNLFSLLGSPGTFYVPYHRRQTDELPVHELDGIRDVNILFTEGIIRNGKIHILNPPDDMRFVGKSKLGLRIHRIEEDE